MGTIIEHPTDRNLQHVWSKLDSLSPGQIIEVKNETPKFQELWIKCAKMYMDCFKNIVEFNSDYSKVKKLKPFNNLFTLFTL